MVGYDLGIRQHDLVGLHPDYREQHLPLWRLGGREDGLLDAGLGLEPGSGRSHRIVPPPPHQPIGWPAGCVASDDDPPHGPLQGPTLFWSRNARGLMPL